MLILPEVFLVDAPLCILVRKEKVESLLLLLLTDMEEELHDKIAVVRELALCDIDAFDPLSVRLLVDGPFKHSVRDLFHPACVKELELAGFRDFKEIAIKERFSLLLFCRSGVHRSDLEEARINALYNFSHHASLAGAAPSFKNDHDRKLGFLDSHLVGSELGLFYLQCSFNGFFVRLRCLNKIFQHKCLL